MSDYIYRARVGEDVTKQPPLKEVVLFGNKFKVYDDTWRNHLHVITSYKCNARCDFCVEKFSTCQEHNDLSLVLSKIVDELGSAGILHTVSITGGEPSIYGGLNKVLSCLPTSVFVTVNTNGTRIDDLLKMQRFDWVNLSRHYVDDKSNESVFKCSVPDLKRIKQLNRDCTKLRLQAVVNDETRVNDFLNLIEGGYCDDVSFRSLMLNGGEEAEKSLDKYYQLIDEAFSLGSKIVCQEVQDYYIYETHEIEDKFITFSYSDMALALRADALDASNFIREFILYPDGTLTGSWDKTKKIILKES